MTAPSQVFTTFDYAGPFASGRPGLGEHPEQIDPLVHVFMLLCFGSGRIAGTVKVITTPSPGHRVRLYHKASGALVRETTSDGSGHYAFENVSTRLPFYVTAEYTTDAGGLYNATIEDYVVPA